MAYVYRSSAGLTQSQNFVPFQGGHAVSASQTYSSPVNLSAPSVAQGANFTRVAYSPERYALQSGGTGVSIKYQSIPNTQYSSSGHHQQQNVYTTSENIMIPIKMHQEEMISRVDPINVQTAYVERVVQPVQAMSVPVIVKPPVQFISRYEKKEEHVKKSGEDCSQYKLRIQELELELSLTKEKVLIS
jgi:hypothetical protein